MQHTATHCNTLQHTATHCNTLHTLQHTAIDRSSNEWMSASNVRIQGSFAYCNAATHCNTLQHTAARCNTPQLTDLPMGGSAHQILEYRVSLHTASLQNTASATHCNTRQHTATRWSFGLHSFIGTCTFIGLVGYMVDPGPSGRMETRLGRQKYWKVSRLLCLIHKSHCAVAECCCRVLLQSVVAVCFCRKSAHFTFITQNKYRANCQKFCFHR